MVPLLFSLCGRAQAVAGLGAAEGALEVPAGEAALRARRWLVMSEAVQEYLWRLLIDLPRLFDLPAAAEALAKVRAAIRASWVPVIGDGRWTRPGEETCEPDRALCDEAAGAVADCLEREVFGCPLEAWRHIADSAAFDGWLRGCTTPVGKALWRIAAQPFPASEVPACLPAAGHRGWVGEIVGALAGEAGFASAPVWRGMNCETGALARNRDHPLIESLVEAGGDPRLLRLAARLVALEQLARRLTDVDAGESDGGGFGGASAGGASGYGWVETARGLLMHHVALEDERVRSYQVLAPTEWNFHPEGPLKRELAQLDAADETALRRQAEVSVLALDPCVAYEVHIAHA